MTCLEALILKNLLDCNRRFFSRRVQQRGLEDDTKGAVADDLQVIVLNFPRSASLAVRDVDFDDLPRIVKLCGTWTNGSARDGAAKTRVNVSISVQIRKYFETHG